MNGQIYINDSGRITPCPYIDRCSVYGVGCQGGCYWCQMFDERKDKSNGRNKNNSATA